MKVFNQILTSCLLSAFMLITSLSATVAQSEGCVVVVPINASSDDAEESGDDADANIVEAGDVSLTSSDLEMTFDGPRGRQVVGLRFNGIQIPNGVSIASAYIQFTAERVNVDPTTLTLQGESADNAPTFSDAEFDISSRPRTTASVEWTPAEWTVIGEVGEDQKTADISSILEEIVARPGWSAGNSIVIIITGAEKRSAVSFDGDPSMAPVLYVEFGGEGTACNDEDETTINDMINSDCQCVGQLDSDGDGTPDDDEECDLDPDKTEPGICGCGVADTDTDEDGTLDCEDGCPEDPNKTAPGECGCGMADEDTDGDGVIDCAMDECPNDPDKTEAGACGCGTPDTDTDGDGTPDCNDECPTNPDKVEAGYCGCDVPETDTDGDGTPDCSDWCQEDPDKIEEGQCGCGTPDTDTDGDGIADCVDPCPENPDEDCEEVDGEAEPVCPDLDGCENEITFLACDQVVVCTGEKITQIVVDLGPTGFEHYNIDPKFTAINGAHWEYTAPEGQKINGLWVKTLGFCDKCGDEEEFSCVDCVGDPCPRGNGGGRYYAMDLCECGDEEAADVDEDGIPDCRDLCPDDPANQCDANAGGDDEDDNGDDDENGDDDNGNADDPGDDDDDNNGHVCTELEGCDNEITFPACDQVVVCTGEMITQIVVDLGPTGFQTYSVDPKFTAIVDTHWEYTAPEGETIRGVWVKTLGFCDKCGDEDEFSCMDCEGDPCPRGAGGGRYYRNELEECVLDPETSPQARINLELYPNPTTQHLFIQFDNPDARPGLVQVLNANGDRIYETNINEWTEDNLSVDLANAPHGLYFLRVILDNGIVLTKQFVLAR